jgi:hypothetical protein
MHVYILYLYDDQACSGGGVELTLSVLKYSALWFLKSVLKYNAFYMCQCLDLAKFIKKWNHNLRRNILIGINLWVQVSFEDSFKLSLNF